LYNKSLINLAAKFGYIDILYVLKDYMELKYCSKKVFFCYKRFKKIFKLILCPKTGLTALHVATYYGQTEFCREMLMQVPGNISSQNLEGIQNLDKILLEVFILLQRLKLK
jgi:hypothetical protein